MPAAPKRSHEVQCSLDGKTHQSMTPALEMPPLRLQGPLGGTGLTQFWHYFGVLDTNSLISNKQKTPLSSCLQHQGTQ